MHCATRPGIADPQTRTCWRWATEAISLTLCPLGGDEGAAAGGLRRAAHGRGHTRDILLAPEVIEVNQDPLGVAGDWVVANTSDVVKVLAAPLHDGVRVAVFFIMQQANQTGSAPLEIKVDFHRHLGLPTGTTAVVRDLYTRRNLGTVAGAFSAAAAPEDCAALHITPQSGPRMATLALA